MATIEKRVTTAGKISFRAKVRLRGHAPISRTFEWKRDAEKWARDQETDIQRGKLVSTEADRTTLKEALERYQQEVTPTKKGWRREQDRITAWTKHPLSHRFLSQLRGADFSNHRDDRRAEGRAENTIRLKLALIRHLYKIAARDWGMEGLRNPIHSLTMPGGSNERERRLTADEGKLLLTQLERINPYLAPLASMAIETAKVLRCCRSICLSFLRTCSCWST